MNILNFNLIIYNLETALTPPRKPLLIDKSDGIKYTFNKNDI